MNEPDRMRQRIASNIRAEVARTGRKGPALAEPLGLNRSTVYRKLTAQLPFFGHEIAMIAVFLDVPLTTLFADVIRSGEGATPAVGSTLKTP